MSRSPGMGESDHYERHRPENTPLYRVVQDRAETFFAQVEAETAHGLPDYVKTGCAFLDCGILANGFLRLQCGDCLLGLAGGALALGLVQAAITWIEPEIQTLARLYQSQ